MSERDRMEELTGTISFLFDHKSHGFLWYLDKGGTEQSVFFSTDVCKFKSRSSIWFNGDKVSFYMEQKEGTKPCARITQYHGNELLDALNQRLAESNSMSYMDI